MRVLRKTWVFFCGYNPEYHSWDIRLGWGGQEASETLARLYQWRREVWFSIPLKLKGNGWWRLCRPRLKTHWSKP